MLLCFNAARFSCVSPENPVALCVCEGLFGVSQLHTLFSQISGRICRFAFVAESWRNKILSPLICSSYRLFLCILCGQGSQASRPSRISLPSHKLKFSSFISLFVFFRPPRSSRTSLHPSAHSTPVAPSQDKQPLY